jgi:hypothetical protein
VLGDHRRHQLDPAARGRLRGHVVRLVMPRGSPGRCAARASAALAALEVDRVAQEHDTRR